MAIKTQGTNLYTIDTADDSLMIVGCITSIDGIDTTLDQIDITCLDALARSYFAGLANPGTATFGINTDSADNTHVRLHQLKVPGTILQWAVGWSDGTAVPTISVDSQGDATFVADPSRTWLTFEGYMTSYPFGFQQNSIVQSTIGIQISGEPLFIPKTA